MFATLLLPHPRAIFFNYNRKTGEIWDSRVVVQHIWGNFGLIAFKVSLGSFGVLAIFRNLGLMIRDRRKHFEFLYELNGER